jgi:hypothetical protein
VTGGWRKLHNEKIHNLCSSSIILRMIKSIMMRWAGHVARIREVRNIWLESLKRRDHSEDLSVDGSIILK